MKFFFIYNEIKIIFCKTDFPFHMGMWQVNLKNPPEFAHILLQIILHVFNVIDWSDAVISKYLSNFPL